MSIFRRRPSQDNPPPQSVPAVPSGPAAGETLELNEGETRWLAELRTMIPDAEQYGPRLSSKHDPRVVRGLGWMRNTRSRSKTSFAFPRMMRSTRAGTSDSASQPSCTSCVMARVIPRRAIRAWPGTISTGM